ncbi:protein FAM71E1 [Crotalus adamanteus]|uniref:Protein FAM71E1 n=1 Tax=Crotalus adamanteus TaxID=8729 RepID=A0AAW1B4M8_CROAD
MGKKLYTLRKIGPIELRLSQSLHHSSLDLFVSSRYPSFEMGDLRRCLDSGEYGTLKDCHLYESNFLQVTKAGDIASRVTMGIAASSSFLEMPDLMLLARPVPCLTERCECQCPEALPFPDEELQLFALLPLKFVRLYVHDESRFQLKVRLANGRTFYLQLLTHPLKQDKVFGHWIRLLYRLRFYHSDAPLTYEKENVLHHHRNTFI